MRNSAQFRVQMAELGHPVLGPSSLWKLTPAEIRIYAEGLEQKRESHSDGAPAQSGGNYDKASKEKRDEEIFQEVQQRVNEHES